MKIDSIRKALHARPFEPFHIHLADGGRLGPVEHQDFISMDPSGRQLSLFLHDGSWHLIDVMLVTRLESKVPKGGGDALGSLREEYGSGVNIEKIRELLHAEPFRPFFVHLADADCVLVEHRDFVALRRDGSEMIVELPSGGRSIAIASITRLEIQSGGESPRKP